LDRSTSLIILSIVKNDGQMLFNPSAGTVIGAGEKAMAVGTSNRLRRLEEALNPR